MSTDSTELTFVRCPSCRSLVPAVSTRCRMCGSAIDAQGKEATEPEAPRRARPSAPSQPSAEVMTVAEPAPKAAVAEPQGESDYEEFDPLRDYLDEDQVAAAAPVTKPTVVEGSRSTASPEYREEAPPVTAADPQAFDDDDFDIFGDDDSDDDGWLDPVMEEVPAAVEKKEVKPEPLAVEPEPRQEAPAPKPERISSPKMNGGGHGSAAPSREGNRVVVESGARPAGKPSGLSFGKGRQEEPAARQQPARESRPESKPQERGDKGSRPQQQASTPRHQPQQEKRAPQQEQRRESSQPKPVQTKHPVPERHDKHQERSVPAAEVHKVRNDAGKAPVQEGVDSRLVGWLVSFSTPTRSSIELREGKFFVGGNSLKPNDLVLEDPSISTPHAMVAVDAGRLQVQDLMSESGVFRRRQGESDYVQFGEPFDLKHGDWVRFGKVDFLVTMIPAENKR